jgi:hypothetical protein
MFQPLIDQGRDMIRRLYASAEQGRDAAPEASKIRPSELEAWDSAARGIIRTLFGADAAELAWWQALAERRAALVGEAMRKDIKRGEYLGLIDFFHLAIGVLLEFEAKYQHRLAAPNAAPAPVAAALADQLAPPAQAPAARAANGWELTIELTGDTYHWLADAAAAREPADDEDEDAAARLAATIIERVAANSRHKQRS